MSRRRWLLLVTLVLVVVGVSVWADVLPDWLGSAGVLLAVLLAIEALRGDPRKPSRWQREAGEQQVVLTSVPTRRRAQAHALLRQCGWEHAQIPGLLAGLPAVAVRDVSEDAGRRLVADFARHGCEAELQPQPTTDVSATQAPRPA